MQIYTTQFQSILGTVTLGATNQGLCFAGISKDSLQKLKQLSVKINGIDSNIINTNITKVTNTHLQKTHTQLQEYFQKKRQIFDISLHLIGTDFQKKVWNALLAIPYGTTCSYRQEAQNLDKPTAFRAVANANGANNIIIIIPCHRVIASDGGLGGYSSGIENKKVLLKLEQ